MGRPQPRKHNFREGNAYDKLVNGQNLSPLGRQGLDDIAHKQGSCFRRIGCVPTGYPAEGVEGPAIGWQGRQLCEAESADGIHWTRLGFIPPDSDTPACHVPEAVVLEQDGQCWLYVFYACQIGGGPLTYDFRYDRIRYMKRSITVAPGPMDVRADRVRDAYGRRCCALALTCGQEK